MPSIYQRSKLRSTKVKQPHFNKHTKAVQSWESRRYVKTGFPLNIPFKSIEEVTQYLSRPLLTCLLCGNEFKWLSGTHLKRVHNISEREYKTKYNLPWTCALMCQELKDKRTAIVMKYAYPLLNKSKPQDQPNYKVNRETSGYKRLVNANNVLKSPTHKKKWPHEKGWNCPCDECKLRRNKKHRENYNRNKQ